MRLKLLVLFALAMTFAAGCKKQPGSGTASGDIVVGEYASLTGGTATFGISSHNGVMLALDRINSQGGVLGRKIKVITEDDASKSDEAVTAVSKLVNRDKVVAVIGEVASSRSLSGAGVCQSAGIPMLSPASTNPKVTEQDYIFRICFTDDFQGKIDAQFAQDKGWKRVAVLTDVANDYSMGLADAFKQNYKSGTIVAQENFRAGDKNFESTINKIKAANPDAVYLPAYYTEVGLIVTQARRQGLKVPFFGGDGWDSDTTLSNPDCEGCYYSDHYSADSPRKETREFVEAYKKMYNGKEPDAMAVLGYDAMGVMAQAIKNAGKADPKAIREALANIKNYPGASGDITIDANRNASKPIVVLKIENGKAVIAKTYEPNK